MTVGVAADLFLPLLKYYTRRKLVGRISEFDGFLSRYGFARLLREPLRFAHRRLRLTESRPTYYTGAQR